MSFSLSSLNHAAEPDPVTAPLTPRSNTASTYGAISEMGSGLERNATGATGATGAAGATDATGLNEEFNDIVDENFVELAITSSGLRAVMAKYPDGLLLHTICRTAKVFARARPKDKKFIVEEIMRKPNGLKFAHGSTLPPDDVLFCGDGANDMDAMHSATLGLSLCVIPKCLWLHLLLASPVRPRPFCMSSQRVAGDSLLCTQRFTLPYSLA